MGRGTNETVSDAFLTVVGLRRGSSREYEDEIAKQPAETLQLGKEGGVPYLVRLVSPGMPLGAPGVGMVTVSAETEIEFYDPDVDGVPAHVCTELGRMARRLPLSQLLNYRGGNTDFRFGVERDSSLSLSDTNKMYRWLENMESSL